MSGFGPGMFPRGTRVLLVADPVECDFPPNEGSTDIPERPAGGKVRRKARIDAWCRRIVAWGPAHPRPRRWFSMRHRSPPRPHADPPRRPGTPDDRLCTL
ncbi:hypothetical protein GCM10022140_48500 [Rhodococcus aetherivorans]